MTEKVQKDHLADHSRSFITMRVWQQGSLKCARKFSPPAASWSGPIFHMLYVQLIFAARGGWGLGVQLLEIAQHEHGSTQHVFTHQLKNFLRLRRAKVSVITAV